MTSAAVTRALLTHDEQDALRIVDLAVTLAAMPSFVSAEASALARTRLRQLAHDNPGSVEVLAAIEQHLEER